MLALVIKKKKGNYTAYAAHFFLSLVLPSRSLTSYADRTDFTLLLLKQILKKKKKQVLASATWNVW